MADEQAATPTREQMIAALTGQGMHPAAPTAAGATPTRAQMIAQLTGKPAAAPEETSGVLGKASDHGFIKGALDWAPTAGSVVGGIAGATAGSVVPGAGTAAGEIGGAAAGGAAGSVVKDALNAWLFGEKKSGENIGKDALTEGAISGVSQGVGMVAGKALSYAAGKLGETVVGKSVLDKYMEASDAVKSLIKSSDGDIATAADQVRTGISKSLDEFRGTMNQEISGALEKSTARIDPADILESLEAAKSKVHGDLPGAEGYRSQLEGWISSVRKMGDENGQIFVQDANELKRALQDAATSAYRSAGEGAKGTEIANALKNAGAITRKAVNEAAPEVAAANNKLATLHYIEDRMNKSIIQVGKSESGLVAAGKYAAGKTEGNARNARALRLLGDLTGNDFLGKAQELAAMKTFSGSSLTRAGVGAGVGAAAGAGLAEVSGGDPYHGALLGGAIGGGLTSPLAVKSAIDIGKAMPVQAAPLARQTLGQAVMHGTGATKALRQVGQ